MSRLSLFILFLRGPTSLLDLADLNSLGVICFENAVQEMSFMSWPWPCTRRGEVRFKTREIRRWEYRANTLWSAAVHAGHASSFDYLAKPIADSIANMQCKKLSFQGGKGMLAVVNGVNEICTYLAISSPARATQITLMNGWSWYSALITKEHGSFRWRTRFGPNRKFSVFYLKMDCSYLWGQKGSIQSRKTGVSIHIIAHF